MKYFLSIVVFLTVQKISAQFTDNFTDADFTTNPTWIGDDSVFTVLDVSGNMQLRSNKTQPSTSFYLSTASSQSTDAQWELYTHLAFNTSSANYVDIYLMADQSNLYSASLNGYFVRIGGTTDEISLYRKVSGTAVKIIDGTDGITNISNNELKIKVTRSISDDWILYRDNSGTGSTYFTEGTVNDATVNASNYFGIAITQSTATFFQKHFFDDIYVGPIILDVTPPVLLTATVIGTTQLDVLFNEPLDQTSAETSSNYILSPSIIISSAILDGSNPALVHLLLATPLVNGTDYTLTTNSISDVSLNSSGNLSSNFTYVVAETPLPGDVILTEFVCDETPTIGLPEVEYVEIYNKSNKYFDLQNWKLGDASGDGTIQQSWLYPGEYRVLCSTSNVDTFTMTVPAGVSSFPSLNNSGDDIVLKDDNGNELDRISYTIDWYKDPLKEDGGYSIELINPNDPCSAEDNWKASNAVIGGTPGSVNSVNDITPDSETPQIVQTVPIAPNLLEIYFNEGMDSTLLADALIAISPTLTVQSILITGTAPSMMTIQFVENLLGSQIYTITLGNVGDCWLNTVNLNAQFALPEAPQIGDILINEILFDPYTGGSDWIEVYNNSTKLIDLKDWQLANYEDSVANNETIDYHYYLKPGNYAVLGEDSSFVKQYYPATIPGTFVYCGTPSYNADSSTVYLVYLGQVMDKVSYSSEWHFKLLDVTDGVTLERIDPMGTSNDLNNWHSAAEAIGFGTPGSKNSQYQPSISDGVFSFTSSTISPDNDGFEDILQVNYEMAEGGLLGTFTIYDDRGRLIRTLIKSELLGTSGTFNWDGVTDENVKASIGTYVAVFEAFAINGGLIYNKTKAFVVAGTIK